MDSWERECLDKHFGEIDFKEEIAFIEKNIAGYDTEEGIIFLTSPCPDISYCKLLKEVGNKAYWLKEFCSNKYFNSKINKCRMLNGLKFSGFPILDVYLSSDDLKDNQNEKIFPPPYIVDVPLSSDDLESSQSKKTLSHT